MKLFAVILLALSVVLITLPHTAHCKAPNIIFILTDDQDVEIGGLTPIPKIRKLIGDAGIHFTNAFTTSPLCCPSRSSILTGNYVHNNGALNNSISGNCSSPAWQRTSEKAAFVTELQAQGYRTFFAGKYLNQYGMKQTGGTEHVPPGWSEWHGLVGNSVYYNYTLSVNGKKEVHGDNYEKDYLTNVITQRATQFLNNHIDKNRAEPFFMMLSTPACHSPWNSAPQYAKKFSNVTAPKNGSFNYLGKDKHWLVRSAKHPLGNSSLEMIENAFKSRWRTLLSVDDMVEQVISLLNKSQILDTTYLVFSSDNGYHLGQMSLPIDKRQMYEFDIRVPLMVRGPGIKPQQVRKEIVLNIDFAPTFMDLAGVPAPPFHVDGRSFKQLLVNYTESVATGGLGNRVRGQEGEPVAPWRMDFLVEHSGEVQLKISGCPALNLQNVSQCFPDCVCEDAQNNTYGCVRTINQTSDTMYCEFSDSENFVEVYNLKTDPHQLVNIAKKVDPSILMAMNRRLLQLSVCSGASCQKPPNTAHYV